MTETQQTTGRRAIHVAVPRFRLGLAVILGLLSLLLIL